MQPGQAGENGQCAGETIVAAKILRIFLVGASVVALIGVLALLYAKTRSVDADKKAEVEGYLKQLKQLDAEWNVDVLKSRMEINKNYDPLTSPLPTLMELQEKLRLEANAIKQSGTQKALAALKAVIDEKIDLVDQFKAQNAILKNSLRYAPTAVDELRLQIRNARRESPAQADELHSLDTRANQVLNDILKYNLLPDVGSAQGIVVTLIRMERGDVAYPETI